MADSRARKPYVRLISSDGFEFVVSREAACVSGTIRNMIGGSGEFVETRDNTCRFPEIDAMLLEKVCEYMYFNIKYQNAPEVPEFDPPPGMALELLVAADYLDI